MQCYVHYFEPTDEWLVIEKGKILIICQTEEKAEEYIPKFKVGDYVDAPYESKTNFVIKEVGRCVEGDLFYDVFGINYYSFEPIELIPAVNPPRD